MRDVALRANVSHMSVARHKDYCIPQLFVTHENKLRGGLLGKVDSLEKTFRGWLENPKKDHQAGKLLIDLIDKEAKLTGAYQQDRSNETDAEMKRIQELINVFAQQRNMEYSEAARYFFENIAQAIGIKPELQQKLLPE